MGAMSFKTLYQSTSVSSKGLVIWMVGATIRLASLAHGLRPLRIEPEQGLSAPSEHSEPRDYTKEPLKNNLLA